MLSAEQMVIDENRRIRAKEEPKEGQREDYLEE